MKTVGAWFPAKKATFASFLGTNHSPTLLTPVLAAAFSRERRRQHKVVVALCKLKHEKLSCFALEQ